MEATQPEIPKKAARALKARLQVVKKHLEPLLEKPLNEIYTKLPVTERYELQVLLTYSLNTLFYINLRTNGSDPQKHEVMNELIRVQNYIQKLKKAQGKEEKPTMKIDKDAAARFIKSAINESNSGAENKEKKRKLDDDNGSSSNSSSEDEMEEGEIDDKKKNRKMDAFSKKKSSSTKKKQKK